MTKRTSPGDLQDWDDAQDLNHIVHDKRDGKRATPAKGRRRNRRYENRLLKFQVEGAESLDETD
ncbi:hypothetical protein ACKFKF_10635 [Phormidesmis sp. 146-12]